MAIVDKTHSQTIEEAFNSVAEGGSGGDSPSVKIIRYFIGDAVTPMVGGFVKDADEEGEEIVYYTFEEMDELFRQFGGNLLTMNLFDTRAVAPITRSNAVGPGDFFEADISYCFFPDEEGEIIAYGTRDYIRVNENAYPEHNYVSRHNFRWEVESND